MKPKCKPHVHYAATSEGVYLRTWTNEVEIKGKNLYEWIEQIIPYLDGQKTVEELTGNLPEPQKGFVNALILELVKRGIVIDASEDCRTEIGEEEARLYRQTLLFLEDATVQGRTVFRAFRERRLVLVGKGLVYKALVRSLVKTGLQAPVIERDGEPSVDAFISEWSSKDASLQVDWLEAKSEIEWLERTSVRPEMVVLASDGYEEERTQALVAVCRARGIPLLVAATYGGLGVIGPVMDASSHTSWDDVLDRLSVATADREACESPVVKMLLGSTAALETVKYLTGLHDLGVRDQAILIDPEHLATTHHALAPIPLPEAANDREAVLRLFRTRREEQAQDAFLYEMEAYKDERVGLLHALHPGDFWQIPMALTQSIVKIPHRYGGQLVPVIAGGEMINEATEKAVREGFLAYARLLEKRFNTPLPDADLWSWSHGRTYQEWVGRGILNALAEKGRREEHRLTRYQAEEVCLPKELPYLKMLHVRYGLDVELAAVSLGVCGATRVLVLHGGQVLGEGAGRTPFEAMREALVAAMVQAQVQTHHPELAAAALETAERSAFAMGQKLVIEKTEPQDWAEWTEQAVAALQEQGIDVVYAPWHADKAIFEQGVLVGQIGLNGKGEAHR